MRAGERPGARLCACLPPSSQVGLQWDASRGGLPWAFAGCTVVGGTRSAQGCWVGAEVPFSFARTPTQPNSLPNRSVAVSSLLPGPWVWGGRDSTVQHRYNPKATQKIGRRSDRVLCTSSHGCLTCKVMYLRPCLIMQLGVLGTGQRLQGSLAFHSISRPQCTTVQTNTQVRNSLP